MHPLIHNVHTHTRNNLYLHEEGVLLFMPERVRAEIELQVHVGGDVLHPLHFIFCPVRFSRSFGFSYLFLLMPLLKRGISKRRKRGISRKRWKRW